MNNRKEEILLTALHLFAQNGYEAVSVSQIAGELGITKGALYRHYQNKRDIFDHIVLRMEQGDSEQAADYLMPQEKATVDLQQKISVKQFISYSKSMFEYWTEEDFASSFRKMLTLEQFRNEEMQRLYQQYLVAGPAEYVNQLFVNMGISDPQESANQFYGTMFFFYSLYDGAKDREKIKKLFEQTINQFAEKLN